MYDLAEDLFPHTTFAGNEHRQVGRCHPGSYTECIVQTRCISYNAKTLFDASDLVCHEALFDRCHYRFGHMADEGGRSGISDLYKYIISCGGVLLWKHYHLILVGTTAHILC